MELVDDYKIKKLKNRIAGRWFPEMRSPIFVFIETVGRGMAMTIRILIRREIGVENFTFWIILAGVLWLRLCVSLSAATPAEVKIFDNLFNPLAFTDVSTGILNVASYLFVMACSFYFLKTEFGNQVLLNVINRGESDVFAFMIKEDSLIVLRQSFVQSFTVPAIGVLLGSLLQLFSHTNGLGIYFLGSSIALFIDEANYHRARIRLERIKISKENQARIQTEKYRRIKAKQGLH